MKKQSNVSRKKISLAAGVSTLAPLNIAEFFAKNDNNIFKSPQKNTAFGRFCPKKSFFFCPLVAGAWTERKKIFLGGSFLKLADDNKYIKNPEAQNWALRGF